MMNFVEQHLKSVEKTELTLGVDDWNTPAINLYHSLGYEIFKEEPGRTPKEVLFLLKKTTVAAKLCRHCSSQNAIKELRVEA